MTLATDIYITGTGVTQREVFDKVNEILEIPDERIVRDGPNAYRFDPGDYEIANALGQGFSAIVETHANADGSLITKQKDEEDEEDNGEEPESFHVHVGLDTSYGYRDARGWDCSRLHAFVILQLAMWLEDRECTVRWVNEYAGTVHDANDREAFESFIGNGDEAGEWFSSVVMPAILEDRV